jgi:uncharacterized protein YegL
MIEETGAKKTLKIFVLADTSGSMSVGGRIESLNAAMEDVIPELRESQANNVFADMQMQVIDFSTGAQWANVDSQPVADFTWAPRVASGVTDLGAGIELLIEALKPDKMGRRCMPPVVILLTDGAPTDDWEKALTKLNSSGWGKRGRTTRIGIAIGQDADKETLTKFTGNMETVFEANNATQLTALIKWASVEVSKQASMGASTVGPDPDAAPGDSGASAAPTPAPAPLPPPPVATSDDDDVW